MWKRLLLLSLIQASLFSHASAARIKRALKSITQASTEDTTEDTVQVQGGANGWLIVMCEHAKGLKNTDWGGKADPFCQIELQDPSKYSQWRSDGLYNRSNITVSRSVGLYKEDTVNGSKSNRIRLNEHVAFDLKSPKSLDQFKVKVSVRDDDDAFGNGVGSYNGGDLMGSKTWTLPPRGKESVKFVNNNYRSINDNTSEIGSWKYQIRSEVDYKWVAGSKLSEVPDIPGAWEIQGKTSFDDGSQGTLEYRIRWCPETNLDSEDAKKWKRIREKGVRGDRSMFDDRLWVFNSAPPCVVQGFRKLSWPSYCSGGKCPGVNAGVRKVSA